MVKERGFAEMIRDLVEDRLGDGYEVSIREVVKNNGTELTGLSIGAKDASIAPTIYLEGLEERFEKRMISAGEAAEEVVRLFMKERPQDPSSILKIFMDAEEIYKRVVPKVINAERNEGFLKTVPHVRFLDLAEIFLVKMEIGGSIGNVTIKNDLAGQLGLDIERLKKAAFENMRKRGIDRRSLSSMISDLLFEAGEFPEEFEEPAGISMMVVTNQEKYNGACCLLDSEIFVDMADELESDLFVLPSSVHEVIVLPASDQCSTDELRELVRSVNDTTVGDEDFLSDSIYRFDRATAELQVA